MLRILCGWLEARVLHQSPQAKSMNTTKYSLIALEQTVGPAYLSYKRVLITVRSRAFTTATNARTTGAREPSGKAATPRDPPP